MFTIVDLSNRIHDDAETNAPPVCELAIAQTNTITKPLPHLVPPTSPSTSPSTSLSSSPSTSPSRSPSSSNYKIQTHRSDRFKLWWFFLQRQCDIWSRIKIFSSRITRLINWERNVWGYWQGPTGRVFLLRDGTGRVIAKKFGYRDGSGRVVRQF